MNSILRITATLVLAGALAGATGCASDGGSAGSSSLGSGGSAASGGSSNGLAGIFNSGADLAREVQTMRTDGEAPGSETDDDGVGEPYNPGGSSSASPSGVPAKITLRNGGDRDTYENTGQRGRQGGSGFEYGGYWYRPVSGLGGVEFVPGNSSSGNGFWQSSTYWVPSGSGSGGSGGGSADLPDDMPEVINLSHNGYDETYVYSGYRGRRGGSGFEYNGYWYERTNSKRDGTRYEEGRSGDGKGFWQHSRYWVED